jgi:hypothetical protein
MPPHGIATAFSWASLRIELGVLPAPKPSFTKEAWLELNAGLLSGHSITHASRPTKVLVDAAFVSTNSCHPMATPSCPVVHHKVRHSQEVPQLSHLWTLDG